MGDEPLKNTTPAPQYQHAEAFCLMKYETKDGRVVEYLWNSRDGVTPFGVSTRDGSDTLYHTEWKRDQRRPNHVPQIGDRIFVDATQEDHRNWIKKRVERDWNGPLSEMARQMFTSPEDMEQRLFEGEWQEGQPNLITVDLEWLQDFFSEDESTAAYGGQGLEGRRL